MKQENNPAKSAKYVYTIFWCSIVITVIAVGVVAIMCYKGGCFSIHSINFGDASVAALCAITAILLGWNIYSVIDMKNLKEDTERRVDDMVNERIEDLSTCLRSYVDARDVTTDGMRLEPALSVEMLLVNVDRVKSKHYKEIAEKDVIMKLYFICYIFHKEELNLLNGRKERYIEILNGMGEIDKKKEVMDAISKAEYTAER